MANESAVADHYGSGGLLESIRAGLVQSGKSPEGVTVEDLAPVDEFHIGGRQASEDFLGQLGLSPDQHVLDVGAGLGGASRYAAQRWGVRVTGIDLTPEFVETGRALSDWAGLAGRVELHQGSALATGFDGAAFDAAFMLHVGMNIPDKPALFAETARVLRPGCLFGVYDVMRLSEGPLTYPVPWATTEDTSALASPDQYKTALADAGFAIVTERNRRGFALEFFENLRKRTEAAGGPPPLGLHLVMGESAPTKIRNMVENIAAGRVGPVELIARKPA